MSSCDNALKSRRPSPLSLALFLTLALVTAFLGMLIGIRISHLHTDWPKAHSGGQMNALTKYGGGDNCQYMVNGTNYYLPFDFSYWTFRYNPKDPSEVCGEPIYLVLYHDSDYLIFPRHHHAQTAQEWSNLYRPTEKR